MVDLTEPPIFMQAAAVMAGVVLLVAIVGRFRNAMLALAGMAFVASIGVAETWRGVELRTWIYPIQASRSILFLGIGVLLIIASLAQSRLLSRRAFTSQGVVLLLIGVYDGLMRMVHDSVVSGMQTIAFVIATIVPVLLVVQAVLDEEDDCLALIRAMMLMNIVWIGGVAVQVVVNPYILTGGEARFLGLSPNPQNAGLTFAYLSTFVLWLIFNDPKRHLRPLWIALFSLNALFIVASGSRTAAGTFAIGAMIATYARLGRVILMLPLLLLVLFGALKLGSAVFAELGEAAERIGSLQDTRTGVWVRMIEQAMEHPWIGVGIYETKSENSYLKAFASYGVGMLALVLLLVGVSVRIVWRLYWLRRWMDPHRRAIADLVIAFMGMYLAASMLEGIMIARVGLPLLLMLMFSVIGSDLLRRETDRIALEAEGDLPDEYSEYADEGESAPAYEEADHPA